MTLHVGEPSMELTDGVRGVLRQRAERGRLATPALREADVDELTLGVPHRVFTLTLDDLVERRGLDAAHPMGWRYLVQRHDRAIAAVEAPDVPNGELDALMQVNEGPFVGATFDAIRNAEQIDEVREGSYELRLLKILPLYTIALWLRPDGGGTDLLIPIGQAHPALEPSRVYDAGEFVEALAEPAAEAARSDNRPKG